MWQTAVTVLILTGVVIFLVRRVIRWIKGDRTPDCAFCPRRCTGPGKGEVSHPPATEEPSRRPRQDETERKGS